MAWQSRAWFVDRTLFGAAPQFAALALSLIYSRRPGSAAGGDVIGPGGFRGRRPSKSARINTPRRFHDRSRKPRRFAHGRLGVPARGARRAPGINRSRAPGIFYVTNSPFLCVPRGFSTQSPTISVRTVPVLNRLFATRYWLLTTLAAAKGRAKLTRLVGCGNAPMLPIAGCPKHRTAGAGAVPIEQCRDDRAQSAAKCGEFPTAACRKLHSVAALARLLLLPTASAHTKMFARP